MNLEDPEGLSWNPFKWGTKKVADKSAGSISGSAIKKAYCQAMKASFPAGACETVHETLKKVCTIPALAKANAEYYLRCYSTTHGGVDLLHCDDNKTK